MRDWGLIAVLGSERAPADGSASRAPCDWDVARSTLKCRAYGFDDFMDSDRGAAPIDGDDRAGDVAGAG